MLADVSKERTVFTFRFQNKPRGVSMKKWRQAERNKTQMDYLPELYKEAVGYFKI
jgi:hypothetical protein